MTITTLKASPHLLKSTLELIESSFTYEKAHQFSTDFAPLIDKSNHHNCFIKIDEKENVIAHVGVSERKLLGLPVAMLGGIAVDEKHRGEGHFQELFGDVLAEKRSDVALFLLWSDQEKLYRKFGFHLCGTQLETQSHGKRTGFNQTKYHLLTTNQQQRIQNLYRDSFSNLYTTVERNDDDWRALSQIRSADLFIKEINGVISGYFFMNKGQDLNDIIYEYGTEGKIEDFLTEISPFGKVWLALPLVETQEAQYQFFLAPGDTKIFAEFIRLHTRQQIQIRDINPMKQEVYFDFNEELLGLETEEFLRGMFGPAPFEELGEVKPIFISGLDSI